MNWRIFWHFCLKKQFKPEFFFFWKWKQVLNTTMTFYCLLNWYSEIVWKHSQWLRSNIINFTVVLFTPYPALFCLQFPQEKYITSAAKSASPQLCLSAVWSCTHTVGFKSFFKLETAACHYRKHHWWKLWEWTKTVKFKAEKPDQWAERCYKAWKCRVRWVYLCQWHLSYCT